MHLINGNYDVYGLKSKSKPDVVFEYDSHIDIHAIDDNEDSAMEVIKSKVIEEFGEFNIDRLSVESNRSIDKECFIGWNVIDF